MSLQASKKTSPPGQFDKYDLYLRAVQSPETDVRFYRRVYRKINKDDPRTLREDFCGTFALCAEWVKMHSQNQAYGIDLDPEPLQYGREHHWNKLKPAQQDRLQVFQKNVLHSPVKKVDVVAAVNFSYFIFKSRQQLLAYFKAAYKGLRPQGIFVTDIFGGSDCYSEIEEKTKYRDFTYFWHQRSFDPISGDAKFSIHFQRKGGRKLKDQFTYDWRLWSIPEVREVMLEAGFKKTHVYWEGTNKKGRGNGVFRRTEKGEECQGWIAYVIGEK